MLVCNTVGVYRFSPCLNVTFTPSPPRLATNQEQVFPLNLERIFQGADPDFYLRDADIVCVGTHVAVPFMTALRGIVPSFSMGFSYSKNFSRIGATQEGERFKNY